MSNRLLGLAAAVFLLSPALYGEGPAAHPRINRLQQRERQLIRRGIRNDELTRQETRRLLREQARIRRMEVRSLSDGRLTVGERRRLVNQLQHAGAHIYRDTHDRR